MHPKPAPQAGGSSLMVRKTSLKESGLNDFLVLLSICHTCHYKGVSFLKFLLSRERDIDAFCLRPRRRRRLPTIEVYPKGVVRPDYRPRIHANSRLKTADPEVNLPGS